MEYSLEVMQIVIIWGVRLGEKISTTLKQLNDTQGKAVPNLYDMDQFSETRINLKWRVLWLDRSIESERKYLRGGEIVRTLSGSKNDWTSNWVILLQGHNSL